MKRVITKIGDIFEVKISDTSKGYFQYIADDMSQLNSAVIRAFSKRYSIESDVSLDEIIAGKIDFHWHTFIKLGVKMGFWIKIGNHSNLGNLDNVMFRDTPDYGRLNFNYEYDVSKSWNVWKINGLRSEVGELTNEYKKAEVGIVLPADTVVHRMKTGKHDFVYPRFE